MTDAGFFRGTSADQDFRFANKQKKLLKELNFSPILNTKLDMSKIDVNSLKPWIESRIKNVLEKDDELLSESIYEHLSEREPVDGKNILVLITGFVEEAKASKFMEELWSKLIELQDNVEKNSEKVVASGRISPTHQDIVSETLKIDRNDSDSSRHRSQHEPDRRDDRHHHRSRHGDGHHSRRHRHSSSDSGSHDNSRERHGHHHHHHKRHKKEKKSHRHHHHGSHSSSRRRRSRSRDRDSSSDRHSRHSRSQKSSRKDRH